MEERALINIHRYVSSIKGKPFVLGKLDCNLMALNVLDIITGKDFSSKLFGKYNSYEEVEKAKKGNEILSFFDELKTMEVQIGFEQTGDFVLQNDVEHSVISVSVVINSNILVATEKYGMVLIPLSFIDKDNLLRIMRVL